MTHPYKIRAKTGQQLAASRYSPVPNKTPMSDPVLDDAESNPRGQVADEVFNGAPTRQISNSGKVRK